MDKLFYMWYRHIGDVLERPLFEAGCGFLAGSRFFDSIEVLGICVNKSLKKFGFYEK